MSDASQDQSSSALSPDQRAFLDAARMGDIDRVRGLLAQGVPVDLREDFCVHYMQNEQTALMYAAGAGQLEIVRLLLKAGADVKAIDKLMSREAGGEQTALHYAARQPNVAVVEELLNAGADPNALNRNAWNRGYTPLLFALRQGHREVAELLIRRGASLATKIGRKQAMSPLCALINEADDEVPNETVRDLAVLVLEAGADPNGIGDANQTVIFALARAEANNPKDLPLDIANALLEKLLKAGAKPDWPDKFGSTALQNALMRKNPAAVRLLLAAGADVNQVWTRGAPLDIVESDIAGCEKRVRELAASPAPADEKAAGRRKQLEAILTDELRRCRETSEILRQFGARRKSELPPAN